MAYRPLLAENQRHTNDAKWGWSERMVLFELPAEIITNWRVVLMAAHEQWPLGTNECICRLNWAVLIQILLVDCR